MHGVVASRTQQLAKARREAFRREGTSSAATKGQLSLSDGFGGVLERLGDVCRFEVWESARISSTVMASATMPTTVATGCATHGCRGRRPSCPAKP
jgi:hypothetical protein